MGRDRESSTTTLNSSKSGYSSRKTPAAYDSFITSQEDLVTHFSRISMRQVQATINNNKMAILPSILPHAQHLNYILYILKLISASMLQVLYHIAITVFSISLHVYNVYTVDLECFTFFVLYIQWFNTQNVVLKSLA